MLMARDPLTGVQIRIGVMGSAGGDVDPAVAERCRRLGRAVAGQECCLLTGACPGLPHQVVLAAKEAGGHVVGGRSGTLGEFAIAYEQGKLIGVLTGSGGITAALPALEASLDKRTGSEVMYESDPDLLVDRLVGRYLSTGYKCPCHPASPVPRSGEEEAPRTAATPSFLPRWDRLTARWRAAGPKKEGTR
jgi:hypothetical protein